MSERLIEELKTENLCTYFVLPLLKLSKVSFVKSNFIDCYITRDGRIIVVAVYMLSLLSRKVYAEEYALTVTDKGINYILYETPQRWKRDIGLFMKGKFSKMSMIAKEYIRTYSGLEYQKPVGRKRRLTDGRLLALERDTALKEMWERMYNVELGEDDELLSIPGDKSYIDWLPEIEKHQL